MTPMTIRPLSKRSRCEYGPFLCLVAFAAASAGCGAQSDTRNDGTEVLAPSVHSEAPPERPQLASQRIVRQAPAFRRASQTEVAAFLARKNGGNPAPELSAAEIDAVVADATSSDPARKRDGLRRVHEAIRTQPLAESRRLIGERLRVAQELARSTPVALDREGSRQ